MPAASAETRPRRRAPADGRVHLRTSTAAKEVIARAAASLGTTVSAFVAQSAYDAAQQLLKQQEMLVLSQTEMAAFARALSRPPKPTAALRRLMRPL